MKKNRNEKYFNEASREWLYYKKLSIKLSTYDKYEVIVTNHLNQKFNDCVLSQFNEEMIINYFHELKEERNLSASTLKSIRYVLKSILEYAQEKYESQVINFTHIKLAKPKNEFKTFTVLQREKLEKYCFNHYENITLVVLLALYGGFRIGEVTGLKWKDIDIDNGVIHVNRTIERLRNSDESKLKTKLMTLEPKTFFSKRIVPMPCFIIEYINEYMDIHECVNLEAYVFNNLESIPDPRCVQYNFKRICKTLNFNINFHALRHEYATSCVKNNIDVKSLSEMLGHSSVSITLELYVHSNLEFKKNQINKLKKPSFIAEL